MDTCHKVVHEGDPRMSHLLFMKSPIYFVVIQLLYLFAVRLGPKIMENYKPLKLKTMLMVYNSLLVMMSIYMFKEAILTLYLLKYNFWCNQVDYSIDPSALRMADLFWWFFFSKVIELLDTVFIILRKKFNQITFLHVYHHSIVLCTCWTGARYFPGGIGMAGVLLNSFVHTIMYSYYGLSLLGDQVRKYLWWKRYLTQLQLAQFAFGLVFLGYNTYNNCPFPRFILYATGFNLVILFSLFINFYFKTYIEKRIYSQKLNNSVKTD